MAEDDQPADRALADALNELGRKLDTVAGAVASIAASHTELRAKVTEAEARRGQDSRDTVQRLSALERAFLTVPVAGMGPIGPSHDGPPPIDVEELRADVALSLEVLVRVAEVVERLDRRSEEGPGSAPGSSDALALLGTTAAATEALVTRVSQHTDAALAGAVRMIDGRLAVLRDDLQRHPGSAGESASPGQGFEAGAVMGAAQAAWNRLEQRLDSEFDDLGRQLAALAELAETAAASADAAASRPVVSGDQLRKAATSMKESVVGASRSRWARRGHRGIGPGS